VPHFLTLYEKSVPVIVVRVCAEDPVVSLNSRYRHRGFRVGSNIHAGTQKAKQNMRVRRNRACQAGTRSSGYISAKSIQLPHYQHFPESYPASTKISSPRTSTAQQSTPTVGFCPTLPVVTSYCHPCHGQVTIFPSMTPWPSGPPRCKQVLLMA